MSDTSPSEEEDVDPNITEDEYMKHLFIDLLYDTAMCLAQECVKSSCQGFGHAFGAGLNAQRASVWLGFGNMLKEALLTLKANSDPKKGQMKIMIRQNVQKNPLYKQLKQNRF